MVVGRRDTIGSYLTLNVNNWNFKRIKQLSIKQLFKVFLETNKSYLNTISTIESKNPYNINLGPNI